MQASVMVPQIVPAVPSVLGGLMMERKDKGFLGVGGGLAITPSHAAASAATNSYMLSPAIAAARLVAAQHQQTAAGAWSDQRLVGATSMASSPSAPLLSLGDRDYRRDRVAGGGARSSLDNATYNTYTHSSQSQQPSSLPRHNSADRLLNDRDRINGGNVISPRSELMHDRTDRDRRHRRSSGRPVPGTLLAPLVHPSSSSASAANGRTSSNAINSGDDGSARDASGTSVPGSVEAPL
jgi:hypothetical protein